MFGNHCFLVLSLFLAINQAMTAATKVEATTDSTTAVNVVSQSTITSGMQSIFAYPPPLRFY